MGCSCLNENVARDVRVTLSLCPGSQKGQVSRTSASHQGEQEGSKQQHKEVRCNLHSSSLSDAFHTCTCSAIFFN